ncbi:Polyketide cyclase/dehydrase [Corchorus capsularis]|uniref:Polyketide cyclase/dehydrase n=1 Tax=Corchorus capsularis TaxID=210143 RepID=A0A1R3JMW1_COCAP|nr:Polyketide cyclase/dehydrase [Corchorus capsularis]
MEQNENSQPSPKWEAKVSARLKKSSADQVWPVYTDFFNFDKWFPGLATCYGDHGTNGEPGCIRYVSGFSISSQKGSGGADKGSLRWAKERLIALDHGERRLSYEIVDGNIGFNSYVATVKIVPAGAYHHDDHDDGQGQDGCVIEWSFTVDPVEGLKLDDMKNKFEVGLQGVVKRIEDANLSSN